MQLVESMQLDWLLKQCLAADEKGQNYLAQDLNFSLQAVVPSCIPGLVHNLKTAQPEQVIRKLSLLSKQQNESQHRSGRSYTLIATG